MVIIKMLQERFCGRKETHVEYERFLEELDREAYHEGEVEWEEDGLTVTRTYNYSAPGCHDSCGILLYTDAEASSSRRKAIRWIPTQTQTLHALP
jgi:hypothetical protein